MNNYQVFDFDIIDHKNEYVLSAYALSITPLTFVPKINNYHHTGVIWDFGDGTQSSSLTAKKYYDKPGNYAVTLTIYDCFSNALLSNIVKIVNISHYLPHTFKIDFTDPSLYDNIEWKNGKINGPITCSAMYPLSTSPSNIFYRVYGSNSQYYFQDVVYKFQHLKNNYSCYEKIYNNTKKDYEFVEIDSVGIDTVPIFVKLDQNNIVISEENNEDAIFAGLSGNKQIYFKDDSANKITIDFFFDKRSNNIWDNNLKVSLSANIIENDEIDKFTITTNGLDGEFYLQNTFNIDTQKFANVEIPFVVKIKDWDHFTVKSFHPLSASNISFVVLSAGDIIPNEYYTITNKNVFDGSIRNSIIFKNNEKLTNVSITTSATISSLEDQYYTIEGSSTIFDVYPQNFLKITKKNEDYDATEIFKDLRFQEFLLDDTVLFDDFIGSIFGNLSSSYDTLGKKIYEKTTNFVENLQDVDRNEIFSLVSQMEMLGTPNNVYDSNLFTYPEKVKRILDIYSISENKLLGIRNKFKENFDIKGHVSKDFYGVNLGDEIDTKSYVVSAGIPIVALEKFSNSYTLLNTEQPTEYTSSNQFPLSTYNQNWGWGLVLPDTYEYSDIEKYYLFFEYNNVYENTLYDNTIIIDNTMYDMLSSDNAIRDEDGFPILTEDGEFLLSEYDIPDYKNFTMNILLRDTLYQSLSLIK